MGKQVHIFCVTFHSGDPHTVTWNHRRRFHILWTVSLRASELKC